MKGFSRANLMYMRAFAEAWPDAGIVQQAVGQLPWGHNLVLLTKLKDARLRLAYAERAIHHGWSRNMLTIHMETRLLEREGQAVTNFQTQLPPAQSDLARESLKDPYRPGFLGPREDAGKLNFYLSAVDAQMKSEQDNPTVGLLLCKSQMRVDIERETRVRESTGQRVFSFRTRVSAAIHRQVAPAHRVS